MIALDHRICAPSQPVCTLVTGTTEQPRKLFRVRYKSSDGQIHDLYYNYLNQIRQVDATLVSDLAPDWVNAWQVILNKILQLNFDYTGITEEDYRV